MPTLWDLEGVVLPTIHDGTNPNPALERHLQVLQNLRVLQNAGLDLDFVLRGIDCLEVEPAAVVR